MNQLDTKKKSRKVIQGKAKFIIFIKQKSFLLNVH